MTKKFFFLLLTPLFLCVCILFSSCAVTPTKADLNLLEENIVDDNYRNYYEIFVYSYCDSDGDGYGDINGVTSKLEYLRDIGYTGIWLMPINPSPSYHKYDVTNYYDIDGAYGTLDDFSNLLTTAHKLGINVIIDLVVNHTSSEHTWFKQCMQAHFNGDTQNAYYDYYNVADSSLSGYHYYDSDDGKTRLWYESQFDYAMPDLNLDCDAVRDEIASIIKFWLDLGCDGFRLDACTSFYTGDTTKSANMCAWLLETATAINPDCYLVGEVWDNVSTIKKYYEAAPGMSFFYFQTSSTYTDNAIIKLASANNLYSLMSSVLSTANGGISAPFLCNHDMNRICGTMGRTQEKVKFAYGLLSLFNGTTFTYYGDEIGMVGSGSDPNRRIAMLWSNDMEQLVEPTGATSVSYIFDGVSEQYLDENSILSYYKLTNNIRNAFPEISRGSLSRIGYADDSKVLIVEKSWNDSTITIIINMNSTETTVNYNELTIGASLSVSGENVIYSDGYIMPAYSYAILQ